MQYRHNLMMLEAMVLPPRPGAPAAARQEAGDGSAGAWPGASRCPCSGQHAKSQSDFLSAEPSSYKFPINLTPPVFLTAMPGSKPFLPSFLGEEVLPISPKTKRKEKRGK